MLETQVSLLPETAKQEEVRYFELKRLELLAQQLDAEIKTHEQGALFRDAFEWRFEFPEVLDEAGAFRGFDVVIGNPPYILPRLNFHSISGAFTTSVAGQLEVPNKRKLQRVGLLHLQRSRFNTIG